MNKLEGNFLLKEYIDASIHTSSNILPISLLEQVAFHLKKNNDENNHIINQEEVN